MSWTPTSTTTADWGRYQVRVGGRDVTYFRRVETEVTDYEDQEPFGSGPAGLVFPGITELEKLGVGALSWLRGMPNPSDVDLYRIAPDGTREAAPRWSGFVSKFTRNAAVNNGDLTVQLSGAVQGSMALTLHQPRQNYALRDIGHLMVRGMRAPGVRIGPFEEIVTGLETRKRGSRSQYLIDWFAELLSVAQTDDGNQWTLRRDPTRRRSVSLVLKDRTTVHATFQAGARGVELGLAQDVTEQPNRLFGEGVGPDGDRWMNGFSPNLKPETVPPFPGNLSLGDSGDDVRVWQAEVHSDNYQVGDEWAYKNGIFGQAEEDTAKEIQRGAGLPVTGVVNAATWAATWANGTNSANLGGAYFAPIAADPRTIRWLYTSNGSISAPNPDFDSTVLPVETLISYGEGVPKRRAKRWAQRQLDKDAASPGWYGTITVSIDPPEMSRRDLAAGMNVLLLDFDGEPAGVLFHVASARHDTSSTDLPVTLTMDTNARDLLSIAEMMDRDRESRQDPARSYLNQRRRSAHVRDTVTGWDKERGLGSFPDTALPGGQWSIIRVPVNHFGAIISTELTADPPCKFYAAAFGAHVSAHTLETLNPSPAVARADQYDPWNVPAIQDQLGHSNRTGLRLCMTWGSPGQAAGCWPGEEQKGHPATGKLVDDASWTYILDPDHAPWLYLAVHPSSDCTISGDLKAQVDE